MNTRDHDELLSAYVDGLTTPDENRRVENDPALAARAEAIRAAVQITATPVPDDDEVVVDAAVATAISHSATAANVTALRPGARQPRRRLLAIGAAAAVVAAVFLAGALILSLDDGGDGGEDLAADSDTTQDNGESIAQEAADEATLGDEAGDFDEPSGDEPSGGGTDGRSATEATEEAAAADSETESDADASMSDMESADDAADEAAAPTEESSLLLFATAEELVAAAEAGEVPFEVESVALPCDIQLDTSGEFGSPAVVFASLPDGAVVVTGIVTDSGFEADRIVRVDDCTTLDVPSP